MCSVLGTRRGGLELAGFVARRTGLEAGFPEGAVIAEVRGASATPKEAHTRPGPRRQSTLTEAARAQLGFSTE